MIIIEGPDGSGKTRLAHRLRDELGLPIAAKVVDSDTKPMVPDLRQWVDDNLAAGFQRMIFDRHRLISEPIYGMALPHKWDENQEFWSDWFWLASSLRRFIALKPVIVVCLPPLPEVIKNLTKNKLNETVFPYTPAIYRGYQSFAAWGINHGVDMIYDYTDTDGLDPIESLKHRIIRRLHGPSVVVNMNQGAAPWR